MALTDDELENLARQVIDTSLPAPDDGDGYSFHHDEFIAFARSVEAAEREECAKVAEHGEWKLTKTGKGIASAIRKRSNAERNL